MRLRSGGRENVPRVPARRGRACAGEGESGRAWILSSAPPRPAAGLEVGAARRHFVPLSAGEGKSRGFTKAAAFLVRFWSEELSTAHSVWI